MGKFEDLVSEMARKVDFIFDHLCSLDEKEKFFEQSDSFSYSVKVMARDENFMKKSSQYLDKLAGLGNVTFIEDKSQITERCTAIVTHTAEVMIPMGDLVDFEKERERILKEIAGAEAEINKANGLLANQGFVAKAPQKLIDNEKEKLARAIDKLAKLKEKLQELN